MQRKIIKIKNSLVTFVCYFCSDFFKTLNPLYDLEANVHLIHR